MFEVIHGVNHRLLARDRHLSRLGMSCARLGFEAPDLPSWQRAIDRAVELVDDDGEFALRLVLTGGGAGGAHAIGWVAVEPVDEATIASRSSASTASLFDRGIRAGASDEAPWLLIGAKTLSYAANLAVAAAAKQRGVDEAIYVSSDGLVLEAPTSSFVALRGDTLITPDPALGLLPGTTQQELFALAPELGLRTEYGRLPADQISTLDGAWLTASMRLVSPLGAIDGQSLPVDQDLTDRMNSMLLRTAK